MAVAAAPCEERGGGRAAPIGEHGRVWWPALSVLSLLLGRAAFGSRALVQRAKSARSARDLSNRFTGRGV